MDERNEILFVGIDTSNYTTSVALCDGTGRILLNRKIPLPVREGEKGLRQSDAVFHHVKGLPEAADSVRKALSEFGEYKVACVGYSATPRDAEGSYMPCFLAGKSAAELASALLGVPSYGFSHQAGHVMAALASACDNEGLDRRELMRKPFLAFHVSGGTTDVLLCKPGTAEGRLFEITQIGGTKDINAGQAIDRCGVLMGIPFPCGAEMDRAALRFEGKVRRDKLSVDGLQCNLSGLQNKSEAMYRETESVEETSAYVLDFIGRTLEKITLHALDRYGNMPVIYAGGVMSSAYIKKRLGQYGIFASPQYSSDNASGTALLAREKYLSETEQDGQ